MHARGALGLLPFRTRTAPASPPSTRPPGPQAHGDRHPLDAAGTGAPWPPDRAGAAAGRRVWHRVLAGLAEPTLVAPAATNGTEALDHLDVHLRAGLVTRLNRLAGEYGWTVPTVVHLAWALLLAGLTRRQDIVFGVADDGGPDTRTLPVRVRLDPAVALTELLAALARQRALTAGYPHVPLAELYRLAGVSPLFDTTVSWLDPAADRPAPSAYPATVPMPVLGLVGWYADPARLRLDHRADVFDRAAAEQVADGLVRVLEAVAAGPTQPVCRVDVFGDEQRRTILAGVPGGCGEPAEETLLELFADRVARVPRAVALVAGADQVTYTELNAWADRLAHPGQALRALYPAGAALAALTADVVVAVLAALKRGVTGAPVFSAAGPTAVLNRLLELQSRCRLTTTDRVLPRPWQGGAPTGWDFFWPLTVGATLILPSAPGQVPTSTATLLHTHRPSTLQLTPEQLTALISAPEMAAGLQRVVCSGGPVPPVLARRLATATGVPLYDLHDLDDTDIR